jgi:SNF2 family DNA or RNA helicase
MFRILEGLKEYSPRQLKDSKDIEQWNAGELSLLMMHPASGGHGLNLQTGGHIIVWFGQSWSLELDQQLNARLDRQGQKKSVIINRIVAKGTMDEDVIRAIKSKEHTQEALMNAVKSRINKYLKKI